MLGLLDLLKFNKDSIQSGKLSKIEGLPNVSIVLSAAVACAKRGYVEIFNDNNTPASLHHILDFSKNYTIKLTPAGDLLAHALPTLQLYDRKVQKSAWVGTELVLDLLPEIEARGGFVIANLDSSAQQEIFFAVEQYIAAGLMTAKDSNNMSRLTRAGKHFCETIQKARSKAGNNVRPASKKREVTQNAVFEKS